MRFLKSDELLTFHKRLIERFGGLYGLRSKDLLESAIAYPTLAISMGINLDIFQVAALYGMHLIKNHAFVDGNKRIGAFAMIYFLQINGVKSNITNKELETMALAIAESKISLEEISRLLQNKLQ